MGLAYFVAGAYFRSTSGFVPLTLVSVPLLLKPLVRGSPTLVTGVLLYKRGAKAEPKTKRENFLLDLTELTATTVNLGIP